SSRCWTDPACTLDTTCRTRIGLLLLRLGYLALMASRSGNRRAMPAVWRSFGVREVSALQPTPYVSGLRTARQRAALQLIRDVSGVGKDSFRPEADTPTAATPRRGARSGRVVGPQFRRPVSARAVRRIISAWPPFPLPSPRTASS